MISVWRALSVRGVTGLVVTALCLAGVGHLLGPMTFPIRFVAGNPTYRMPLVELIAVVGAVVIARLTRPRMWHWERLGHLRPQTMAALTALLGIAAAQIPVLVVFVGFTEIHWYWLLVNSLVLASLVFVLSPLLGALVGGNVVLALYFINGVLFNVVPGMSEYLPIVGFTNRVVIISDFPTAAPDTHWWLAVMMVLAAIWVQWTTVGATDRLMSRGGND